MTVEAMEEIMKYRGGWSLFSISGSGTEFDYVLNDCAIHCVVYPKKEKFQFIYITPGFFKLSSTNLGSFMNEQHFNRWLLKFRKEVRMIDIQSNNGG